MALALWRRQLRQGPPEERLAARSLPAGAALVRLGPILAVGVLAGPVLAGLVGTLLPAFGYLPALGGERLTFVHVRALLATPGLLQSCLASLLSGLAASAFSLLAVMLFVAAWSGTTIFNRVQHLVSPLLAVPHAAAAFGLAFLIAPSGMIARLLSPEVTGWERPPDLLIVNDPMALSLTAGLIAKEIPFLLLITLAALPQVRLGELRAISASFGYGRIAGFVYCVWPAIYRQIRLGVFAVIAFATSVVDVAQILGPTAPPTLAVRLLAWMNDPDLSVRFMAAAGALLQLLVTGFALLVWLALEKVSSVFATACRSNGRRFRRARTVNGLALLVMAGFALLTLAGLGTLALWSVAGLWQFPDALPTEITLKTWLRTAPRIVDPLVTTLLVAALATLLAVTLAILCLMREQERGRPRRLALMLVYLPLLLPQAAFLFGLQILFLLTGIGASLAGLILAHLVFVLPYVMLSLSDPWRAFDRRYEAVAAGLGRRRWSILFRVRLPMLLRAVLTAAAVGFAVSVGLYLPTVLIGEGRLTTITTEAVALASGGNRRVIGVYAFLQLILPAFGFLIATLLPALIFRRFRAMQV
jgi:putative thiamine transport system permease protein